MPYGTAAAAAVLAGLETADVDVAYLTLVDNLINGWMNRAYSFGVVQTAEDEYYDIPTLGIGTLMLHNWPAIVVSELIDDAQASSPTTIQSGNYVLDTIAAIIKLVIPAESSTTAWRRTFSAGYHTVKVTYTYGYASVPTPIVDLANIITGEFAKQNKLETERPTGGAERIRIGDFEQTFGKSETAIQQLLTGAENEILKMCVRNYKVVI